MNFGMSLHADRGADAVLEEAKNADRQGFDSVWLGDRMQSFRKDVGNLPNLPLETWTLATAIGAVTSRVRVSFGILNPAYRNPAVLAKMITTLDQITHGRVICAIGAGGTAGNDYRTYNVIDIAEHDERVRFSREVIELFKALWTNPAPALTTYDGKWVKARELPFNPAPFQKPHPPIWIGGQSEETLASVKRLGDGWVMGRPPETREELAKIIGAPDWPTDRPMTIICSFTDIAIADTHAAAVALAGDGDPASARTLIGTPGECAAKIGELGSWGYNYFKGTFATVEMQERFARSVLPLIERETAPVA